MVNAIFVGAGCVASWLAARVPDDWDCTAVDPGAIAGFPMPVRSLDVLGSDAELQGLIGATDVIVLAVPVDVALGFLDRWHGHLRPDCTLIETLSTKTGFADSAARLVPGLAVAGVNPLFRPQPTSDAGFVLGTSNRDDPRIADLFARIRSHGFTLDQMTVDHHDQVMGAVQGLTHAAALGFGQALLDMAAPEDTMMTPPFRCMAAVFARLITGAPHVAWEIQRHNPYAKAARRHLIDALERLDDHIGRDDLAGFLRDIETAKQDGRLDIDALAATAARLYSVAQTG